MEVAEGYPTAKEDACRLFLSRFSVVLPDGGVGWRASRIARKLREEGSPIGDHDIWVAATAIEREMTLVTRNAPHFRRVPGLRIAAY